GADCRWPRCEACGTRRRAHSSQAAHRMSRAPRLHPDGKTRCPWPGEDPLYVAYHDTEWGVPEYDDRALYEKLILDGFQAGLSWITILRKRDNFRKAFDDFQPEKIARYNAKKVHALMNDAGIVRNRAKIEGAVNSAKSYVKIMEEGPGFSKFLWEFVGAAARSARPLAARYRNRRHRPWPCARCALERADQRRPYFLRGAAHAAGRSRDARADAAGRCRLPARGIAARCAGIRHRRHDLAVQGGARR